MIALVLILFFMAVYLLDTILIFRTPHCPKCNGEMVAAEEDHLICTNCKYVVHLGSEK